MPDPYEDPFGRSVGAGGRTSKTLYAYQGLRLAPAGAATRHGAEACPRDKRGSVCVANDSNRGRRQWLCHDHPQVAFGIRHLAGPRLGQGPEEFKQPILQAIERVLDAAFRETPIPVIDQCRNATAVLLSRWLIAHGYDRSILGYGLGKVATEIAKPPFGCGLGSVAVDRGRRHQRRRGSEPDRAMWASQVPDSV
jgi:hypothetical protein